MIKHSYEEKYKNILFSKIIMSSQILLEKKQSHYIKNVMRLDEGNFLSIFNENEGEYNCQIVKI